jgi:hypothetical protein
MLVSIPSQGGEIDKRDGLRINLLKSLVESLLAGTFLLRSSAPHSVESGAGP